MLSTKKIILVAILILHSFILHAAVETAVAQGIATALSGKKVSDIINEVQLTGVNLIDQSNHTGNALISRAGNEANVLAGNLNFILKDNLNESFNSLSEERKLLLIEAEKMRKELGNTADKAYKFKDSLTLDLNFIVTSLPFVKEKFFIQSIKGLSYLPSNKNFNLKISATTLGIHEGIHTNIKIYDAKDKTNTPLENVIVNQAEQRFFANVSIPQDSLQVKFNDENMTIVPLTVEFEVEKKRGWWIFSWLDKNSYTVPIYLSLYPKKVADIQITTKQPVYDWVNIGDKTKSYITPNRHCKHNCGGQPTRGGNRIEFSVAGGAKPYKEGYKRLINPSQKCTGGNCGFSDSFRLYRTENNTRLIFTWDTWSTPGTWEAKADIEEYQVVNEKSYNSKIIPAYFSKQFTALIPKEFTYGILKIKTFTKNEYEIQIGAPDSKGLLQYQGQTNSGPDKIRVSYRIESPDKVMQSIY